MSERVRRACEALHACEHSGYPVGSTFTMCSRCGAVRNERAPRPEWMRAPLVQALVDALNAEAPIEPGDIARAQCGAVEPGLAAETHRLRCILYAGHSGPHETWNGEWGGDDRFGVR